MILRLRWLCQRCGQLLDAPDLPEYCMLAIGSLLAFTLGAVLYISLPG